MKTYKQCCSQVAIENKIGTTLVTGHRSKYWEQAAEMYAKELKEEINRLKATIAKLRPRYLVDED